MKKWWSTLPQQNKLGLLFTIVIFSGVSCLQAFVFNSPTDTLMRDCMSQMPEYEICDRNHLDTIKKLLDERNQKQ